MLERQEIQEKVEACDVVSLLEPIARADDNYQEAVSQAEVTEEMKVAVGQNRNRYKQGMSDNNQIGYQWSKEANKQEKEELRRAISYRVDKIAYDLLGSANSRLSNRDMLRWGESGNVVIKMRGSKAGLWYNFKEEEEGVILLI